MYENEYDDKFIFSHGTSASRGVMIVFDKSLEFKIHSCLKDLEGRFIIAHCTIQGKNFLLANIYAPTVESENHIFLNKINQELASFTDTDIDFMILQDDWNFTENLSLDRLGGNPRLWTESIAQINDIKDTYDLLDIWRHRNPIKREYTYYRKSEGRASRIDRIHLSDSLQSSIRTADILPSIYSDHSTLLLHIHSKSKKGPGLWRLNTSLLDDIAFKTE